MQELTTEMREKGINSMEWIDREEWIIKIKLKLLVQKRCENIDIMYINKKHIIKFT